MNRPERRNALSRELVRQLSSAFREVGQDEAVRVILLTGSGGAFCSGADLSTIQGVPPQELPERIEEFHELIRSIDEAPQPVLAVIDGGAVGFGADLALACDIRIMAHRAYLQESFVHIGLMPDGGGTLWAERYFGARAFEVLALGQRLTAEDCTELQLTSRVVTADQLEAEATALATTLAGRPPLALRRIKAALGARRRQALQDALATEKAGQTELLRSADFQEGVEAFLQKRSPNFRGE
jgi:enoyl-CoA hydratase/carnithine racemase